MSRSLSALRASVPLLLLFVLLQFTPARAEHYDIAYIWDTNLENVLDYKEKLENLFPPEVGRKLMVVGRDKEYGIIYDQNGSALRSAQIFVRHNELLRKAGLHECYALKDQGYYRLYNISYGVGPHLEALEKIYEQVYDTLGKEVGNDLYIEKIDQDAYALLYLRRGDIRSTYQLSQEHARLLRKMGITTTVIPENNDTIVYGESSHLNNTQATGAAAKAAEQAKQGADIPKIQAQPSEEKRLATRNKKDEETAVSVKTHSSFERNLEEFIQSLREKGKLSQDEISGWMVYDLTRNESIVDINANQVFQAASMIKPFIALAFFHQVQNGRLKYTPESRRKMEAMIQRSNNNAANWLMRKAGGPGQCDAILKASYGHIFKRTAIREYIPAGGRTYRNTAMPSDYIRFLQALWAKKLPYESELRRLMALPKRGRLYDGTSVPNGTLVYNKTGTTAHLCGDMGILVAHTRNGRPYPYALVGIIERRSKASDYGNWMLTRGNIIRQVSSRVYEEMKKEHNLL